MKSELIRTSTASNICTYVLRKKNFKSFKDFVSIYIERQSRIVADDNHLVRPLGSYHEKLVDPTPPWPLHGPNHQNFAPEKLEATHKNPLREAQHLQVTKKS